MDNYNDYVNDYMNSYNCPDCDEAKLQSDKNARKINEVIDQVNALIQVNNETVDFIEEKANEAVKEIAEREVNKVLGNLRTEIDNIMIIVTSKLSKYEIQEAINNYSNIKFLQGEYNFDIDESTGVIFNIPSNKNIIFENGAILNINPNANKGYRGFLVDGVENVTLNNITIVGDKYTHLGTEGEWGNGLEIKNSKNVKIINPKISKCWGDGIYLNNNENTVVEKAILDDNRRQGISYICGVNDTINNPIIYNTNGINPQFGIDIEPNYPSEKIINLVINNPYFKGNDNGGLQIHLKKFDETTEPCDITINNMVCDNNKFQLSGFENPFKGIIVLNNPIFKNCEGIPFMIRAKHYKSARLIVNNLYVEDFACGENASEYDTAIALNLVGAKLTDKVGGIDFINPVIKTSSNTVNNSVYFIDARETKSVLSDINFINPDFPKTKKGHIRKDIDDGSFFIDYTDKISKINTSLGSLFQFTDDAPIVTLTNTGSVGVHMYLESLPISMQQKYTINAYSGQTTIHFRPLGSTTEYLQAIVRPLSTSPINSLKIRNKGKIVFKKIGENEIIIDDIVGEWEVI